MTGFTTDISKDAEFGPNVLKVPGTVIVFFMQTWSQPCRMQFPVVDKIAKDYQGKVKVVQVDIDSCTETAKLYGITNVPAIVVFKSGQKTGQNVGMTNRETILKLAAL